jgi:hypothetical protein
MTGPAVIDHRQMAAAENVSAKKFLLMLRDRKIQKPLAAGSLYVELNKGVFLSERFLQRLNRI